MLTAESAAVASAIPLISLPPALIPFVLSMVIPPSVTLSKDTFFAVPMVILRPVLVMAILSPLTKFTVSPPATAVLLLPLVATFHVAAVLARSLICVSPAVDKLDKSLLAALAACVTASFNFCVAATDTFVPLADVLIKASLPLSPLM